MVLTCVTLRSLSSRHRSAGSIAVSTTGHHYRNCTAELCCAASRAVRRQPLAGARCESCFIELAIAAPTPPGTSKKRASVFAGCTILVKKTAASAQLCKTVGRGLLLGAAKGTTTTKRNHCDGRSVGHSRWCRQPQPKYVILRYQYTTTCLQREACARDQLRGIALASKSAPAT